MLFYTTINTKQKVAPAHFQFQSPIFNIHCVISRFFLLQTKKTFNSFLNRYKSTFVCLHNYVRRTYYNNDDTCLKVHNFLINLVHYKYSLFLFCSNRIAIDICVHFFFIFVPFIFFLFKTIWRKKMQSWELFFITL